MTAAASSSPSARGLLCKACSRPTGAGFRGQGLAILGQGQLDVPPLLAAKVNVLSGLDYVVSTVNASHALSNFDTSYAVICQFQEYYRAI